MKAKIRKIWEIPVSYRADWEKRRYEIAKAAMQAMISNDGYDVYDNSFSSKNAELISHSSIMYADELIKQLQKPAGE